MHSCLCTVCGGVQVKSAVDTGDTYADKVQRADVVTMNAASRPFALWLALVVSCRWSWTWNKTQDVLKDISLTTVICSKRSWTWNHTYCILSTFQWRRLSWCIVYHERRIPIAHMKGWYTCSSQLFHLHIRMYTRRNGTVYNMCCWYN